VQGKGFEPVFTGTTKICRERFNPVDILESCQDQLLHCFRSSEIQFFKFLGKPDTQIPLNVVNMRIPGIPPYGII
jgi:hypothetical protein